MKYFITNKKKKKYPLLIIIVLLTIYLIHIYNLILSNEIINISLTKLEEYTNIYVKKDIVPKNVNLEKLISLKENDNKEIISTDINMNYANEIMVNTISKIQDNIFKIDQNEDNILRHYKNNIYIKIPIFNYKNNVLLSSLGPKVPIRLDFYEHGFGNIDVELSEYGINNALLKVYLTIDIEQKIYVPYKEKKSNKQYKILIGAKIVNGKVPSIYGKTLEKQYSITD